MVATSRSFHSSTDPGGRGALIDEPPDFVDQRRRQRSANFEELGSKRLGIGCCVKYSILTATHHLDFPTGGSGRLDETAFATHPALLPLRGLPQPTGQKTAAA
jgi:hypothetical protein